MGSFPEMYNDPVGIITALLKERLSVDCEQSLFFYARGHLRVPRFARQTTEKKRDCS